jgi:hypothetical protein
VIRPSAHAFRKSRWSNFAGEPPPRLILFVATGTTVGRLGSSPHSLLSAIATEMKRLVLDSDGLSEFNADRFFASLIDAESVVLRISRPIGIDAATMAMAMASIWREGRPIEVDFGRKPPSARTIASLNRAFLAPLLWGEAPPLSGVFRRDDIMNHGVPVFDTMNRLLLTFPSRFHFTNRPTFQATLAASLSRSEIQVPETVIAAVSTILFEIASNVEEYGAYQTELGGPTAFRFMAAQVHDALGEAIAPTARQYLDEYYAAGHARVPGWLQIVVADAGPGLAYPSYLAFARATSRANTDIHSADSAEEIQRFHLVLNSSESTKGTWGRVLNRETRRGEGTKFIRFRLAAVRGYASCRSGRSHAEWWYARPAIGPDDFKGLRGYDVHEAGTVPFRGTTWHLLVPLNPQLALEV